MNEDEIVKQAEANFLEDDEAEPFLNREYAEETKRIYGLLKNKASMGDFDSPQDRAIFDIVQDILRICGEKRVHDTGEGFLNGKEFESLSNLPIEKIKEIRDYCIRCVAEHEFGTGEDLS